MKPALSAALAGLALAAAVAGAADLPPRRSGYEDMSAATRALQDDDSQNPALLWVADGERRFAATCARCHAAGTMRGVAARHPAWDEALGRPLTLAARIGQCHERHLGLPAPAAGSDALLALEAWIARASRGLPLAPPADQRLAPWRERGAALYAQPLGQLGLACTQCHDARAGRRLAGSVIPQGHPTGYPLYRLEWQGMGGLERRLRGCLNGVRAEPWPAGADEYVALELFLKTRAAGMVVDAPAVRP